MNGKGECTRFVPQSRAQHARKLWLQSATRVSGTLTVDAGAAQAITAQGSSLLPSGISAAAGDFPRGAVVAIADAQGRVLARGIARYSSSELNQIKGRRSEEIEAVLGYSHGAAAVHRDDLVRL